MNIFKPVKRTAVDGRVWWVVYNVVDKDYSKIVYFGKYRTRKDCQYAIDKFNNVLNKVLKERFREGA